MEPQPNQRDATGRVGALRDFVTTETVGGALLIGATVVALAVANSPLRHGYHSLWERSVGLPLRTWVNDGLMTFFFLVMGLELKREFVSGQLSDRRRATLPIVAAIGGMIIPAAVFLLLAGRDGRPGWGVPLATDIALVLGVLALLGDRVPAGLRVFLLTLAVVDDLGSVVVIAVSQSSGLHHRWLLGVAASATAAAVTRRLGPTRLPPVMVVGVALWWSLHQAGMNPTMAGVGVAFLLPANSVERIEHRMHPITTYALLPLFAFANAGLELTRHGLADSVTSRTGFSIVAARVIGKPLGIAGGIGLAVKTGIGQAPDGVTIGDLVAGGCLAGMGFTVALYLADLSFDGHEQATAQLAVVASALIAGAVGAIALTNRQR